MTLPLKISEEVDTTHFPDGSKINRTETQYSDGSRCIIEETTDKGGNVVTKKTNIPPRPQSKAEPEQNISQTHTNNGNENMCFSSWNCKKKCIFVCLVLLLLSGAGGVIAYFLSKDDNKTEVQKAGFDYTWDSEEGFFVAPSYSGTNEVYYRTYDNIHSLGECADQCKDIRATSGYWEDIAGSKLCICDLASECLDRQGLSGGTVFSTVAQPSRCEMEYCDYFPDDTDYCGF